MIHLMSNLTLKLYPMNKGQHRIQGVFSIRKFYLCRIICSSELLPLVIDSVFHFILQNRRTKLQMQILSIVFPATGTHSKILTDWYDWCIDCNLLLLANTNPKILMAFSKNEQFFQWFLPLKFRHRNEKLGHAYVYHIPQRIILEFPGTLIAYKILHERIWKFQWKITLW